MKKLMCLAVSAFLALPLAACGDNPPAADSSDPAPITTSSTTATATTLSDDALAAVVRPLLGVPNHAGISYEITGPDYVIANLVARNDMENIYYLNGAATDKSAVDAFCSEWYERTDPLWANYE